MFRIHHLILRVPSLSTPDSLTFHQGVMSSYKNKDTPRCLGSSIPLLKRICFHDVSNQSSFRMLFVIYLAPSFTRGSVLGYVAGMLITRGLLLTLLPVGTRYDLAVGFYIPH